MHITIDSIRYFTSDPESESAIEALQAANGKTSKLQTAIKDAFLLASQNRNGLLFEVAARANEELATKVFNVSTEQASDATKQLRQQWKIDDLESYRATSAIAL